MEAQRDSRHIRHLYLLLYQNMLLYCSRIICFMVGKHKQPRAAHTVLPPLAGIFGVWGSWSCMPQEFLCRIGPLKPRKWGSLWTQEKMGLPTSRNSPQRLPGHISARKESQFSPQGKLGHSGVIPGSHPVDHTEVSNSLWCSPRAQTVSQPTSSDTTYCTADPLHLAMFVPNLGQDVMDKPVTAGARGRFLISLRM